MSKHWFLWRAVNAQGALKTGRWLGNNTFEVQKLLKKEGYFPVIIKPQKICLRGLLQRSGIKWSRFARHLYSLLEAGIPLLQALEIMTSPRGNVSFEQKQWLNVKDSVLAGCDLSEALQQLKSPPSSYVLAMIKAGEHSGSLAKILNEVAVELEQDDAFRQKIRTALTYPSLLLLAVLLVLCGLSLGVLPMYERLFASMDVELPVLTKVIFVVGRKLPVILQVTAALLIAVLLSSKVWKLNRWQQYLKGKVRYLPYLGKVYLLKDLVQFTNILGRLLMTGIPLLEGLRLTSGTLQTSEMLTLTELLMQSVKQGNPIVDVLSASKIFPKEKTEMIAIAEEAGQLDKMFSHISQLLRTDLEYQLKQFTQLLGPALILILAGLIGLVAGGVMVPIFNLSSYLE
ncbi:type II secretory pathway, component PulF [Desulfosporosinus acidiphilus SJ4]|uniref:Type II secretory pathway, component PulF n=1 Tax=Desulfosporosinus acidiphilus (strain DSM 22704 / JCM 16185 / SJ4) TaxID=646529 RepID=I4D8Y6_DESAJ|nr:type II secretion system F family protein [Desulfosporosinus acidiphilus]AFM42260.1 type II secretory pathway, component PulF [Desulfosporosinus acidiphilus SJ4]